MSRFAFCALGISFATGTDGIGVCSRESNRHQDHTCNHDSTKRICAKLLDEGGQPLSWDSGDFWNITGRKDRQWDHQIQQNDGDSWCIAMWATAKLVDAVGCENVTIRCEASDVSYVLAQYADEIQPSVDLKSAQACLKRKCRQGATDVLQLNSEDVPVPAVVSEIPTSLSSHQGRKVFTVAHVVPGIIGMMALVFVGARFFRQMQAEEDEHQAALQENPDNWFCYIE